MYSVLIVDDNEDLLTLLQAYASMAKCDSVFARSAAEAQALLASGTFAMVFLDMHMPGFSGLDLLRERCASTSGPPLPPPPIVVFTGDDSLRSEAFRLGAVGFVRKTQPEEIFLMMQRLVAEASA